MRRQRLAPTAPSPALLAVLLSLVSPCMLAQSFNIDFGPADQAPPANHGAAGLAGFWNALLAPHNTTTQNLVSIDGSVTGVSLWQFGGTDTPTTPDAAVTGDDAALMNDYLITFTPDLESCLSLNNMLPGWYQIVLYARMPARPDVLSYTNCDEEPGNPHLLVGGPWQGEHAEGISYEVHLAQVPGPDGFPGLLRLHSGIAPGADPEDGAALNGVQIRMLGACNADVISAAGTAPDGVVDASDWGFAVARWATRAPAADMAGSDPDAEPGLDGRVNLYDLLAVLRQWGECP